MLNKWWWSSGAEANGGFQIGNSLRFRGTETPSTSASLDNTNITCPATFTYSAWLKTSNRLGTSEYAYLTLFNQNSDAGSGNGPNLWLTVGDTTANPGTFSYYTNAGTTTSFVSSPAFRDPSAWYHVVFTAKPILGKYQGPAVTLVLALLLLRITIFRQAICCSPMCISSTARC